MLFLFLCCSLQAQRVTNLRAEQSGQDIVVLYLFESKSPGEVELFLSRDNGVSWSVLNQSVSGDIGKNISKGEKRILWKVLDERQERLSRACI